MCCCPCPESYPAPCLVCADQTKPKCCDKQASLEFWDYLKNRLKQLQLDIPIEMRPTSIFRTKANCLRVCQRGLILLVYPEGVWYHSVLILVSRAAQIGVGK